MPELPAGTVTSAFVADEPSPAGALAAAEAAVAPFAAPDEPKDLGFGAVVGGENEKRLLNRDGTFNVERKGLRFWESLSLYHAALSTTWLRFLAVLTAGYLLLNAIFATGYLLCGPAALGGTAASTLGGPFWKAFFFSIHTFATIGYGNIVPIGVAANTLVAAESLVGLLAFAIATGVLFARFSRPQGKLSFSRQAVIAPYRGTTAFMFRVANVRSSQLIELEAKVLLSRLKVRGTAHMRSYDQLTLERTRVVFFPMSWTIVHPITETSPLFGLTHEDLLASEAEFLVLLSGVDDGFSQTVHMRTSYKGNEVVYGARFANIYNPLTKDGVLSIDMSRLHEIEPVDLSRSAVNETATWHHTGHFSGYAAPRR